MPASVAIFRKLALSLPEAVEGAHMGHADFRLNKRIFATLSAQAKGCGVLMLTPEQQGAFTAELPNIFEPVPGGWGRNGCTLVHLDRVEQDTLLGALTTAYRNLEAKQAAARQKQATDRQKRSDRKAREEL